MPITFDVPIAPKSVSHYRLTLFFFFFFCPGLVRDICYFRHLAHDRLTVLLRLLLLRLLLPLQLVLIITVCCHNFQFLIVLLLFIFCCFYPNYSTTTISLLLLPFSKSLPLSQTRQIHDLPK